MTENGLLVLGGRRRSCMTFFGPSMMEKNRGRSEGEENFGELPVTVGGRGRSDARFSCTYARVCKALGLTEPELGVGL